MLAGAYKGDGFVAVGDRLVAAAAA